MNPPARGCLRHALENWGASPITLAVAVTLGLAAAGCAGTVTVAEPEVSAAYPADTYGYTPLYYDDNIVYYDDIGAPYYFVGANIHYVPRTYVHYDTLVRHYHRHRPGYDRWYAAHPPRRLDRYDRRYEPISRPPRAPAGTRYEPPVHRDVRRAPPPPPPRAAPAPVRHVTPPPPRPPRAAPPPPVRRISPPPVRRVTPVHPPVPRVSPPRHR
jgi:hypothetical protein